MKIHELKIKDNYYEEIVLGKKKFELRKNDRDYKVGDLITFQVVMEDGRTYSSHLLYQIVYILENVPEYGLQEGYCILGIEELKQFV